MYSNSSIVSSSLRKLSTQNVGRLVLPLSCGGTLSVRGYAASEQQAAMMMFKQTL